MNRIILTIIFPLFPLFFCFPHQITSARIKSEKNNRELASKLDAYLRTATDLGNFSGSVLIAREGKIIISKGYGCANYEHNIANSPVTKFRIASLTKPFTAMAILLLEQLGKLQVKDPISNYISEYPAGNNITIHQLLTHTSGVPNYTYCADQKFYECTELEDLINYVKTWQLAFTPGTSYSYSNSGYILLTYIIEKVSGKKYEEFLSEHIFKPLGMHDTGFDHAEPMLKNRASGYVKEHNQIKNSIAINMQIPQGSGSLYSTVEDLYKWDRALKTQKILRTEYMARFFTPFIPMEGSTTRSHGYGWFIDERFNQKLIEYSGCLRGFLSKYIRFLDEDIIIIILSNLEPASLDESNPFLKITNDIPAFAMSYKIASFQ